MVSMTKHMGSSNNTAAQPLSPLHLVALPRLGHAARCACFVCTADLVIEDYRTERARADGEEDGDTDEDIDFARDRAAAHAEAA